jgi:hypothetical protein
MTPLPASFTEDGFTVRVIRRRGRVALLARTKPGRPEHYEVAIVRHRPDEVIYGRAYASRESMPCAEDWGVSAWTYSPAQCDNPLADAEERFRRESRK